MQTPRHGGRMTLPAKAEKGYLELEQSRDGLVIIGKKQHTDELASILEQYRIPFQRAPAHADEDTLRIERDVDQAQVQELLDAYKNVKGS